MKKIFLILILALLPATIIAGEITLNLDRCAILNDATNRGAESKIALHFNIPDSLTGRRIYYAEIVIPVPVGPLREDSLFELLLYPLINDWQENDIDFQNSEAITDSVLIGTKMVKLGQSNQLRIDITPFIKEVTSGERRNFGLVAMADLLGDLNIQIPENLNEQISGNARIVILFK
jgi:hypothetical protein